MLHCEWQSAFYTQVACLSYSTEHRRRFRGLCPRLSPESLGEKISSLRGKEAARKGPLRGAGHYGFTPGRKFKVASQLH